MCIFCLFWSVLLLSWPARIKLIEFLLTNWRNFASDIGNRLLLPHQWWPPTPLDHGTGLQWPPSGGGQCVRDIFSSIDCMTKFGKIIQRRQLQCSQLRASEPRIPNYLHIFDKKKNEQTSKQTNKLNNKYKRRKCKN